MIDDIPTQTISFSSLVTENIDLSTWNDARFHAITPLISLKGGELTRLVLEDFPALYPVHEVHTRNDSDKANVDIIGTLYERGPSDLDAPSADELKYETADSVPDILKFVDKEKFDELIEDIRSLQARLLVLHGQATSVDHAQRLVGALLPDRILDLLKPPRSYTVQSSDGRSQLDQSQSNHRCDIEAQAEPGVTVLKAINESWSTLKEIGETQQKAFLQYTSANAEVHEEFNKLHLDLLIKQYAARDMFYDATRRCRKHEYKSLNETIKAIDAERNLKVITFLQAKEDTELRLGITYSMFSTSLNL